MKADPNNDPHLDEKDPVWQLLGRAPLPEPDAWFTARTMAACRKSKAQSGFAALTGVWRWALGGGLGVCLAVIPMIIEIKASSSANNSNSSDQNTVQEAFEIVASVPTDPDATPASSPAPPSWKDSSL